MLSPIFYYSQLMKKEDFKPAELIRSPRHGKRRPSLARNMILVTGTVLAGAALLWHKDTLVEKLQVVWHKAAGAVT